MGVIAMEQVESFTQLLLRAVRALSLTGEAAAS